MRAWREFCEVTKFWAFPKSGAIDGCPGPRLFSSCLEQKTPTITEFSISSIKKK